MSRERILAEAFVELADTLVDDYDMMDLLYRLTDVCVELLAVDAAGLLLSDQRGQLAPVAASTGETRLLELFQLQTDDGPCLDCLHTGTPVTVTDMEQAHERWPRFAPRATEAGFASVHALPMRLRTEIIGALNLFANRPGPLPDTDLRLAQALADVATIGILSERAIHRSEVLAEQLQGALNSRTVIEQAKGVLAGRSHLDVDQAFTVLRQHARSHHLKLVELAHQVVTGQADIDAIMTGMNPTDPRSK
ncbi:MAG TPA: GAF and ANTAR domain-containing protein [Pseudonocardia sp.]|jgi:transcriptional regulator with GAF, ATPase, and Fis domain|uniref:GAF and ANTAR domain-containing protein n=1 Tax=Pseudonocardia sp. TaxID=60912 RepID=UPI002CF07B8F|nr:GAF and ANTAR domain-containing protein [Pseudonocardia sp.]HTF46186.1 GAF and ANTAR domain-containing protein [Pseudonocardia sp.]